MEKDNKFYVPDISEFHVGFEFEYFCESGKLLNIDSNISEWKTCVCDADWMLSILDDYEHDYDNIHKEFRVKHLDREDIESLGFITVAKTPQEYGGIAYLRDDFILVHSEKAGEVSILEAKGDGTLFKFIGKIKNKSELKKVLKMIGV